MTGASWPRTLRIRRCDLDRLTRAGLTAAASWGHGPWDRRDRLSVSLSRTGDLDDLAAHADMDWHAVRATVPGRRTPLAALPSAPGRRATMTKIFWIDHEHDRDAASDGVSRYGFYLRDRRDWFEDCLDPDEPHTARFAATAWRIATGPVMSPGYVRCHRRVLRHDVERNDWDGSLVACIDLITGWPQALDCPDARCRGEGWRDWPTEHRFASSDYAYLEPSGQDLVKARYLLASASFRFAVPTGDLPVPVTEPALVGTGLLPAAREAVQAVVTELNRVMGPAVEALERS